MLRSESVVLRPASTDDLELLVMMASDLASTSMASPSPPTPVPSAVIADRLLKGHPAPFTGAPAALEMIVSEPSGVGVGVAGLYHFDRANGTVEIGVSIGRDESRGRGLGREAHELLISYAFSVLNFRRVYGHAKSSNAPAVAICAHLGMTLEGTLRAHRWRLGEYEDLLVFGLLRQEWLAIHRDRASPTS